MYCQFLGIKREKGIKKKKNNNNEVLKIDFFSSKIE